MDWIGHGQQGDLMRQQERTSWVVYTMPIKGNPEGMRAVCEQKEWDAMERDRPGYYTIIRADITNEGEAEKLARGKSGDTPPRATKKLMFQRPAEVVPAEAVVPAEPNPTVASQG